MLSAEYVGALLKDDNADPLLIRLSSFWHEILVFAGDLDVLLCSVFDMASLV